MSRVALLTQLHPVLHSVMKIFLVQITDDSGGVRKTESVKVSQ